MSIRLVQDMKNSLDLVKEGMKIKRIPLKTYAKLLPYLAANAPKIIMAGIGVVVTALLGIPNPLILGRIIDTVIPNKDIGQLLNYVLLLALIQLSVFVFSFLMNYSFTKLSQTVVLTIKQSLFSKVLKLPCSFFDKTQTGYLVSRLKEVDYLSSLFSPAIMKIAIQVFEAGFCLIVMLAVSWKITLVSLIAIPFVYALAYFGMVGVQAATNRTLEHSALASMNMQESLTGIEVVKLLSKEQEEIDKMNMQIKAVAENSTSQSVILSLFTELSLLTAALEGFLVLFVSGMLIAGGSLTIGEYIALSGYLAKIYGCVNSVVMVGISLRPVGVALKRVFALESIVGEDEDPDRNIKLNKVKGQIEFKNINFSYIDGYPVFKDLSLTVEPKDKVLIFGESGSGKSTLMKLLLGTYLPQDGSIYIDNIDLRKVELSSVRENVSVVTQNIFLFNDSILNNILYGRTGATREEAVEAAKLAGAHEFILKLEKGYDTYVGERGVRLSGGQVQRISIARALIRKSNIILFDEAVAHLDDNNVRLIHDVITKVCKDKTCIVISHRADTKWMEGFNKVLYLKEGAIKSA